MVELLDVVHVVNAELNVTLNLKYFDVRKNGHEPSLSPHSQTMIASILSNSFHQSSLPLTFSFGNPQMSTLSAKMQVRLTDDTTRRLPQQAKKSAQTVFRIASTHTATDWRRATR